MKGTIIFMFWIFLVGFQCSSPKRPLVDKIKIVAHLDSLEEISDRNTYDNIDLALTASQEMVKLAHQLNDYEHLGKAYWREAVHLADLGFYEDATRSIYKSIAYYDSSNVSDRSLKIAACYHSLAWFKTYQRDTSQTVVLFHKALSINNKANHKDSIQLSTSYHALGSFYYLYDDKNDSSEYYLKKAIDVHLKIGSVTDEIAQAAVELAQNYIEMGRFQEADSIVVRLKEYPKDELTDYIFAYFKYLEGLKYHHSGLYEKAMKSFLPALEWIESANALHSSSAQNLLSQMVETAQLAGNYEEAFKYLQVLSDSEKNTIFKNKQVVARYIESKLETNRKEKTILQQVEEINWQNRMILGMAVALLIILILVAVVYLSYQKIRQRNVQIETLMRELHHRVKNNLQVISSLLGLQSMQLQSDDAKKAVNEGKDRIRAMSLIHQKLYTGVETTVLNFKEYTEILVKEIAYTYGYQDVVDIRVNMPEIALDVEKSMPLGLIINELVTNAFKHAFLEIEKPVLELSLINMSEHQYQLTIRDNGRGMSDEFNLESCESFGIRLVKILARQIKGSLEVDTVSGLSYSLKFSI